MGAKIGIVSDNYKVKKFEQELEKEGFTDIKKESFTKNTTTIQVVVNTSNQVDQIKNLCERVQGHFQALLN